MINFGTYFVKIRGKWQYFTQKSFFHGINFRELAILHISCDKLLRKWPKFAKVYPAKVSTNKVYKLKILILAISFWGFFGSLRFMNNYSSVLNYRGWNKEEGWTLFRKFIKWGLIIWLIIIGVVERMVKVAT